jgi:hypothetical protein
MKAKSIKGKTARDINVSLDESLKDGFVPSLAIVFISANEQQEDVCKILTEKNIQVFGASSGYEFIDPDLETDSIVMLLLDLNTEYFQLSFVETDGSNTRFAAAQIGEAGLKKFRKPAFLMVSGALSTDGDEIMEGIESACGKGTTIFGGLAADKFLLEKTYVFTNNQFTESGLLALILDGEKISLNGVAVGGWKPVGIDRFITKSKGNVVYSIDNEPAMDFIERYSGKKELNTLNGVDLILASNFQLQLYRDDKHPVMRTPLLSDSNDASITFAAAMPEGSRVRLCLLPGYEVVDESISQFKKYKENQQDADALIMFSCAGRQLSLGPFVSEEIEGVKKIWDAPMAGFFCYGEIGRVPDGYYEFHNMTCSLAILKEN